LKLLLVNDRTYTGKTGSANGIEFVELTFLNVETMQGFRYSAKKDAVNELGIVGPGETVYEVETKEGDNLRLTIVAAKDIGRAKITVEPS